MSRYRVFDSHCDTATELWKKRQTLTNTDCMVSLPQMSEFEGCAMFFAFCTYHGFLPREECRDWYEKPCAYFRSLVAQNAEQLALCASADQYREAVALHKTAIFLSLEGAEGIDCDSGYLDQLRADGISMINLTWNEDNELAGCSFRDGPGLSEQGKEFVRRAQKLGIILDVSHLSDRAFWDLMDITEAPVVASHSNSRAVCPLSRNLTDRQYVAIAQTGGYAGINLYSHFLAENRQAELDDVYRHMDHFLSLNDHALALGGDLDGCDLLPKEFSGLADYSKLADYLEKRGYTKTNIQNIFSNTMEKVVTQCIM